MRSIFSHKIQTSYNIFRASEVTTSFKNLNKTAGLKVHEKYLTTVKSEGMFLNEKKEDLHRSELLIFLMLDRPIFKRMQK